MLPANAKFPTNKLIVNPTPVKIETPYKLNQLELSGICAAPNFTAKYDETITPTCLPINRPKRIPSGTGSSKLDKDNPIRDTPALANANIGIIKNAT